MVTPVGIIHYQGEDHQIGDGNEGELTRALREALCGIHEGNSDLHPEWVYRVPVGQKV